MSDAEQAPQRHRQSKRINLALQGGGAHGAFTWGVLDRLLDDGRFIDGISGTSAGAMNAVVFTDGLARGGAEAHAPADDFWRMVSKRRLPEPRNLDQRSLTTGPLNTLAVQVARCVARCSRPTT